MSDRSARFLKSSVGDGQGHFVAGLGGRLPTAPRRPRSTGKIPAFGGRAGVGGDAFRLKAMFAQRTQGKVPLGLSSIGVDGS